jgi:hypothetical protein
MLNCLGRFQAELHEILDELVKRLYCVFRRVEHSLVGFFPERLKSRVHLAGQGLQLRSVMPCGNGIENALISDSRSCNHGFLIPSKPPLEGFFVSQFF